MEFSTWALYESQRTLDAKCRYNLDHVQIALLRKNINSAV